jgi:hypothetical protein
MTRILVALTLTTLVVLGGSSSSAFAQSGKVASGTIASMDTRSLTVKVGGQDMTFTVDSKTVVEAKGGSTMSARAAANGKPGPHLDEVLKPGQSVAVTYNAISGPPHATMIKAIPKAAASTSGVEGSMKSDGIVKAIGADWITINGRGGAGSTFEQTFKVGAGTKVFAKGAGTAAAATGGRAPFAHLVTNGDHVSVSYRLQGDALLASDVHVTMKATP